MAKDEEKLEIIAPKPKITRREWLRKNGYIKSDIDVPNWMKGK